MSIYIGDKKICGNMFLKRNIIGEKDNFTWYVIYSDGWCEQGGLYYQGSSVKGTTTITFPQEFKDTNYYFNGNAVYNTNTSTANSVLEIYTSRTTTSTSFYIAGGFYGYQWEVKGYIDLTKI